MHSFVSPSFPFLCSLAKSLALSLCSRSCLSDLWVLSHSLSSPSAVCHQGWIPSLHLPLCFPLAVTIPLPLSLPCLYSCSPSVFLLLGRLGYLYIEPPLSWAHVALTQKYNVTMSEGNVDSELTHVNIEGKLWNKFKASLIITSVWGDGLVAERCFCTCKSQFLVPAVGQRHLATDCAVLILGIHFHVTDGTICSSYPLIESLCLIIKHVAAGRS